MPSLREKGLRNLTGGAADTMLGFLDEKSLARMGGVDKRWNILCREDTLWNSHYFSHFRCEQEVEWIKPGLSARRNLVHLYLMRKELKKHVKILLDQDSSKRASVRYLINNAVFLLQPLLKFVRTGALRRFSHPLFIVEEAILAKCCQRLDDAKEPLIVGASIIARTIDPEIRQDQMRKTMRNIAEKAKKSYHEKWEKKGTTVLEELEAKLGAINHVLYSDMGFRSARSDREYYRLENNSLPHVIESRLGQPISMSIIYIILARHLGVEAWGCNMPRHFVAGVRLARGGKSVTRFVDAYDKGLIYDKNGVVNMTNERAQGDITNISKSLGKAPLRQILRRMLANMLHSLSTVSVPWGRNQMMSYERKRRYLAKLNESTLYSLFTSREDIFEENESVQIIDPTLKSISAFRDTFLLHREVPLANLGNELRTFERRTRSTTSST
ncbi:hypothetical protein AAMO2058_000305100 [Amorphochlora amoebiformis]